MHDPERARETLERLAAIGVGLSVDDFGTGYSSLAHLKRLPVDTIKIDKSFVLDMAEDEADEAIVRSTIELAHNLGLRVVAEGVESAADVAAARRARLRPRAGLPPRAAAAGRARAGAARDRARVQLRLVAN